MTGRTTPEYARYIERNPVRAKMVKSPNDWPYSSYGVYAHGRKDDLVTLSIAYQGLANDEATRRQLYCRHVESERPYEEILDRELMNR